MYQTLHWVGEEEKDKFDTLSSLSHLKGEACEGLVRV